MDQSIALQKNVRVLFAAWLAVFAASFFVYQWALTHPGALGPSPFIPWLTMQGAAAIIAVENWRKTLGSDARKNREVALLGRGPGVVMAAELAGFVFLTVQFMAKGSQSGG